MFTQRISWQVFIALILYLFTTITFADSCTHNQCDYSIRFDRAGSYVAKLSLAEDGNAGIWGLAIAPTAESDIQIGSQGFGTGSTLQKSKQNANWAALLVLEQQSINITPYNYSDTTKPVFITIEQNINGERLPIYDSTLMNSEQIYTSPVLEAGFYVITMENEDSEQSFYTGLDVQGSNILWGSGGGWVEPSSPEGYVSFSIPNASTFNFTVLFGDNYQTAGASQVFLDIDFINTAGEREPIWRAYRPPKLLAERPHRVMASGLANSIIEVFNILDTSQPLFTTLRDENGYFGMDNSLFAQLNSDDVLLLKVSQGQFSNDIENKGVLYGFTNVNQLLNGQATVSFVSDIIWQYTQLLLDARSEEAIILRLKALALELISEDITGDGLINELDLFALNVETHEALLNFNRQFLAQDNEAGRSIVRTYHDNTIEERRDLLEQTFGDRLTLYPEKNPAISQVKISVSPFGDGRFSSDKGNIYYDSAQTTFQLDDVYDKSNDIVTFTATPTDETKIARWRGCDTVSPDLTQCSVSLQQDHQITLTFAYKETKIVDNFIDLSNATVTYVDDVTLDVVLDASDTFLIGKMSALVDGYYVAGDTDEGFLRKVLSFTKIDDTHYQLVTEIAGLDEVVERGTGSFSKTLRQDDLEPNQPQVRRGIRLKPSDNPKDDTFTLVIGDPNARNTRLDGKMSGSVVLKEDSFGNPLLSIKGEVELKIHIDFDVSFRWLSLKAFRLIPEVTASENLEVFIGGEVGILDKPECDAEGGPKGACFLIYRKTFKAMKFSIGILPVYIRPIVEIYAGADGTITGKINAISVGAEQTGKVGMSYEKNIGLDFIKEFQNTWKSNISISETEVAGELKTFVRAKPILRFYGVSRFGVPIDFYSRLRATSQSSLDNDFWRNKRCIGGVDIGIWAGVESLFSWDLLGDGAVSKVFKKVLSVDLKSEFSFFKLERSLYSKNIGGEC
ncbi:MAG: hypothetical protein VSS52_011650, partial [Thiotrichaceae bacterium]|nr:hypothetical protein [Thiotrichaceae bacterium]